MYGRRIAISLHLEIFAPAEGTLCMAWFALPFPFMLPNAFLLPRLFMQLLHISIGDLCIMGAAYLILAGTTTTSTTMCIGLATLVCPPHTANRAES